MVFYTKKDKEKTEKSRSFLALVLDKVRESCIIIVSKEGKIEYVKNNIVGKYDFFVFVSDENGSVDIV